VAIPLPYCGTAPLPGELLSRFNFDPKLIVSLILACALHLWIIRRRGGETARRRSAAALGGWVIAAVAFLSPLCALSVALFSARVAQHMLLVLVAAPLLALGMRPQGPAGHPLRLWLAVIMFFLALWYWHMPIPYDETFTSVAAYWAMHLTLFGSAVLLWRELIHHPQADTGQALAAGTLTFVHMGLLGAVLTLAQRPLFQWHLMSTQVWGFSPLQDQQLGGSLMWVPGIALLLWSAIRSLGHLWGSLERARPA
jgi:putative membrane protein